MKWLYSAVMGIVSLQVTLPVLKSVKLVINDFLEKWLLTTFNYILLLTVVPEVTFQVPNNK